jgi:hypothetical protein
MKPGWSKRSRKDEIVTSLRRHWLLKGSVGRVIESRSKFGLPLCFYAVAPLTKMISRHRTKTAAMKAVERYLLRREGAAG